LGSAPDEWIERIHKLVNADEYGAREALLRHADTLFDAPGLRALAARFEEDLDRALRAHRSNERLEHAVFKASAAIGLVADALRDPDLSTRATLRYSPHPNPFQKERFAERYIRFGRPADALPWLEGDWGHREDRRERLRGEVFTALGDEARLRSVRRALFDRTGSVSDFEDWRASLPPAEQANAAEVARGRTQSLDDPVSGAHLLLALDDDAAAEALLVDRHAKVRGEDYERLLHLAAVLEQLGNKALALVHHRTLLPRHRHLPLPRGKCYPCVRYALSPMCRAGQSTWYRKTRCSSRLRDLCATGYPQGARVFPVAPLVALQPFATRRIVRVPTRSSTRLASATRGPTSALA
jgi:hypothetical protein